MGPDRPLEGDAKVEEILKLEDTEGMYGVQVVCVCACWVHIPHTHMILVFFKMDLSYNK